jgi:hypothetical protein
MPAEHKLPDDIAPLARRNALELSDTRWDHDVGRLQQALDQVVVDRPSPVTASPTATVPGRPRSRAPLAGSALVILMGGAPGGRGRLRRPPDPRRLAAGHP